MTRKMVHVISNDTAVMIEACEESYESVIKLRVSSYIRNSGRQIEGEMSSSALYMLYRCLKEMYEGERK